MHDFVSWRPIHQSMGVFSFKHWLETLPINCGWNVTWTSSKQNAKFVRRHLMYQTWENQR